MPPLDAQAYGRWLEAALCARYGWGRHRGSGNQWALPSDAVTASDWQIEIKGFWWNPAAPRRIRVALGRIWPKLCQEAGARGRMPLLVLATSLDWAVGVLAEADAQARWPDQIPEVHQQLPWQGTWREDPATWADPCRVAWREEGLWRVPLAWIV